MQVKTILHYLPPSHVCYHVKEHKINLWFYEKQVGLQGCQKDTVIIVFLHQSLQSSSRIFRHSLSGSCMRPVGTVKTRIFSCTCIDYRKVNRLIITIWTSYVLADIFLQFIRQPTVCICFTWVKLIIHFRWLFYGSNGVLWYNLCQLATLDFFLNIHLLLA